jgi:hypothetical protein
LKTAGLGRSIGLVSSEELWLYLARTSDLIEIGTAVFAVGSAATAYLWNRRKWLRRAAAEGWISLENPARRGWKFASGKTKLLFDKVVASDLTALDLRDDVFLRQLQTSQNPGARQQRSKKNSFSAFSPILRFV